MKRATLLFYTLAISLLLVFLQTPTAYAKSYEGEDSFAYMPALDPIDEVEIRVRSYLRNFLADDQYLVFVNQKTAGQMAELGNFGDDGATEMPGMPGLRAPEPGAKQSYISTDETVIGALARPPVMVSVVLSEDVPGEKQKLLRRVLPAIARIDKTKGDSFRLTTGALSRVDNDREKTSNWIDSIFKYKRDLRNMLLGLAGLLVLLSLVRGGFNFFQAKMGKPNVDTQSATQAAPPMATAQPVASAPAPSSSTGNETSSGKKKLTREELYSQDSAFLQLVSDVVLFAKEHPERISFLLTEWIQQGELGIKNAATLLHNFDLKTSEGILQKLVPTDLDFIKTQYTSNFDPFSEENVRVIYLARMDLMKVTSQFARQMTRDKSLEFLSDLEDDVLAEVLRGQTPLVLAFATAYVPTHRMTKFVKSLKQTEETEFFRALVGLDKIAPEKRFDVINKLTTQYEVAKSMSFTKHAKIDTLSKIIKNIPSPSRQTRILSVIEKSAKDLDSAVRKQVLMFTDILELSEKMLQTVVLEEDPLLVARAFAKTPVEVQEKVQGQLPPASAEIFTSVISASHRLKVPDIERAQTRLVTRLEKLIDEKVIDIADVKPDLEEEDALSQPRAA